MQLTTVRISHFQSILDSNKFEIGGITCLVGKNEAGKTALLRALYRLNPIIETEKDFDATDDYPRRDVSDYQDDVDAGRQEPATVVRAEYSLEPDDVSAVEEVFGPNCLRGPKPSLTLSTGYSNVLEFDGPTVDEGAAISFLLQSSGLSEPIIEKLMACGAIDEMANRLTNVEQTKAVQSLTPMLSTIARDGLQQYLHDEILSPRIPKFLYFDEYYQMKGQENLDNLLQRTKDNSLQESDHPLLGLIELAGLRPEQLINTRRTQTLTSRLEAAENRLTQKVLQYWSQNKHLRMKFDIQPARPEDGAGMTQGTNIWGRVSDTQHMVSTLLGTRSKGFVWFFSFLAWYSKLRKEGKNLILLLDEPGLSLHAKAQGDLLKYFENELKPHHQLIYTTHSPFMVDPTKFGRVRIVQDLSIDAEGDELPAAKEGTRVITDVLEATDDSLFPLQSALGYEIHQSLFVGPNCLVVEGVSDLLYLQTASAVLQRRGKIGLSPEWTVTPVGGSGKVSTFVALMGAQRDLNVAVLIDFKRKDRQRIENLYKSRLLEKRKVLTFDYFTSGGEADVEDLFAAEFYLTLVNREYDTSIYVDDLPQGGPRILGRLEKYLHDKPLPMNAEFNHYRPARYFTENVHTLESSLGEDGLDRFQLAFDALNKLLV